MNIGSRIRQARIAAGLSQARLAELLGVTRSACSQWESSQGTVPRGRRLAELASLLDDNYEWLAMGAGSQGDSSFSPGGGRADPVAGRQLSSKQKELLQLYDRLPAPGQTALMKLLRACADSAEASRPGTVRRRTKKQ